MVFSETGYKDKVFFPKSGITKRELIQYYERIAPFMLPYLIDRPLTLHRFPDGIAQKGFFQKHASDYFPDWIKTVKIKKKDGWVNHVLCNDQDTLTYLAYQGTISFHITLSRLGKLDYPDRLIFDLDPSGNDFEQVMNGAQVLRKLLGETLNLPTYFMLTGSKGVHVVVPLMCVENFDEVRAFTKQIAFYLAEKYPKDFTIAMRKDQRQGRLFIDYLRNSYAQTAICPFSVRAFENAPIALPVSWAELQVIKNSQAFTIKSIFKRIMKVEDPWKDFQQNAVILSSPKKKMQNLIGTED
ncbi:non-homologous end-joining DNA ligase [Maribacter luteus]|uniref:non-homologous end-joining DNA ligase n=1 Tax=Maribacter luteus TaxID=2594478 RepID=UPI002491A450|nr:non-homologous end-joining DNA ligase [Maribacter luteus]